MERTGLFTTAERCTGNPLLNLLGGLGTVSVVKVLTSSRKHLLYLISYDIVRRVGKRLVLLSYLVIRSNR